MLRSFSIIVSSFCTVALIAQNTVGTINYDITRTQEGYNLYFPHSQQTVWLLDNCGQIVHSWPDQDLSPGNSVYLLDDGSIIRCAKASGNVNPNIGAGGAGQFAQRKDWNNNIMWQFEYNDVNVRMHHDIAPMPNGNVLIVAWENKDSLECIQAGRDPQLIADGRLWPDHIVEVEPVGWDSGTVVWEWHAWDHLVQDFDPNMDNYGVVQDHPELIDVNYALHSTHADWLHFNSIDYNPTLDQIMLSVPFFNEIWIIDHSTTTAEAASHSGGNSGMGGDLIYRWGNPMTYDMGDSTDMKLAFQHDAHWMDIGLDPNDPDHGKILVFNNRIGFDHSNVDMIDPPVNGFNYTLNPGSTYGPLNADWTYTAPTPTDFFSSGLAGAQKLNNGNFLICSGRQGWTFEVDPTNNNEIVWEYINPLVSGNPATQGDTIWPNTNVHFRMNRYEPDHPGLVGQNLTPQGYIELQPNTMFCDSVISVGVLEHEAQAISVYPNPVFDVLIVESLTETSIDLFNVNGQLVLSRQLGVGQHRLSLAHLPEGVYILRNEDDRPIKLVKVLEP